MSKKKKKHAYADIRMGLQESYYLTKRKTIIMRKYRSVHACDGASGLPVSLSLHHPLLLLCFQMIGSSTQMMRKGNGVVCAYCMNLFSFAFRKESIFFLTRSKLLVLVEKRVHWPTGCCCPYAFAMKRRRFQLPSHQRIRSKRSSSVFLLIICKLANTN